MSKKTRSAGRRPKKRNKIGRRIVEAWFDTVINPLLRLLEVEQTYLNQKNWTWRFRPAGFELLHHLRESIEIARDNLDQVLEFYPDVKNAVEGHDKKLASLLEKCKQLHYEVEKSAESYELYRRVTSQQCLSDIGATLTDLFGAYPESDHRALLAQYIVNNTSDLPGYYSTARLWNKYKDEFTAIANLPSIRPHHEATTRTGVELLRSVSRIVAILKEKREKLSFKYDVPYVARSGLSAR